MTEAPIVALCARCGKTDQPGVTGYIGFPEEMKTAIRERTCGACWQEWMNTQLMAINEYRLNLGRPEHRQVLADLAGEFLQVIEKSPSETDGPNEGQATLEHLGQQWKPATEEPS